MARGDAARGEQVYRRKEATCLACHAIAGAGGQVGPDMTSIGASAQVDYLVESMLIPKTCAPRSMNSESRFPNSESSFVQPGLKSKT